MNENNIQPLISVVTVSYNAASTIEATILSVLNQTYPNIEYIIIDGGSKDGTLDIIKKYADRISYWISEPDKGIYDAMNKGIDVASGEWIHFLNAGDIFLKIHALEDLINYFSKERIKADVIYGEVVCRFRFGDLLLKPAALSDFNSYFPISHPATLVNSKILKENIFDTTYCIAADYELFYRLYCRNYLFEYVPIALVLFDAVTGVSSNNLILLYKENSRVQSSSDRIKYYSDIVMLRVRKLTSFIIETFLFSKSMRNRYLKKRLLKNKRFSEIRIDLFEKL